MSSSGKQEKKNEACAGTPVKGSPLLCLFEASRDVGRNFDETYFSVKLANFLSMSFHQKENSPFI